jgi:hypothetical protein
MQLIQRASIKLCSWVSPQWIENERTIGSLFKLVKRFIIIDNTSFSHA